MSYSIIKSGSIAATRQPRPQRIGQTMIGVRVDIKQFGYYPEVDRNRPEPDNYQLLREHKFEFNEELQRVEVDYVLVQKPSPDKVTMRQFRLELLARGLLDSVNTAASNAGPEIAIEWEYGSDVERNHPMINSIGAGLGLTERQIDEIFIDAASR